MRLLRKKVSTYEGTGPSLSQWLVISIESGRKLDRRKKLDLAQTGMTGCWCFSRAAILGLVVSCEPEEFLPIVWDPERFDRFWQHVTDEVRQIDVAEGICRRSLSYFRMSTAYPALFDSWSSGDEKMMQRAARLPVPIDDARVCWAADTAVGLGVGIQRPEFVRECLAAEAEQVTVSMAPDTPISVDGQIRSVVDLCGLFFEEYYPSAKAKLDQLTA